MSSWYDLPREQTTIVFLSSLVSLFIFPSIRPSTDTGSVWFGSIQAGPDTVLTCRALEVSRPLSGCRFRSSQHSSRLPRRLRAALGALWCAWAHLSPLVGLFMFLLLILLLFYFYFCCCCLSLVSFFDSSLGVNSTLLNCSISTLDAPQSSSTSIPALQQLSLCFSHALSLSDCQIGSDFRRRQLTSHLFWSSPPVAANGLLSHDFLPHSIASLLVRQFLLGKWWLLLCGSSPLGCLQFSNPKYKVQTWRRQHEKNGISLSKLARFLFHTNYLHPFSFHHSTNETLARCSHFRRSSATTSHWQLLPLSLPLFSFRSFPLNFMVPKSTLTGRHHWNRALILSRK